MTPSPPHMDHASIVRMLEPPTGPCDVVIDTDTYNEVDDQFAIVQALLSDKLNVEAIYAAPFDSPRNTRSSGPGDGMEKSFDEIVRVLEKMPSRYEGAVLKGSTEWMTAPDGPVDNPAMEDLVAAAMRDREGPLYVLTIGAVTNVASAIVAEPRIKDRIVVVALGGTTHHYTDYEDLNFCEDLVATRVIFDSGVPLVHVPGWNVSELMMATEPEMARYVKGRGEIGDYLYEIYCEYVPDEPGRGKPLWDMTVIGYVLNPDWTRHRLTPSPIFNEDLRYSFDWRRHPVRVLEWIDRSAMMGDFFEKLEAAT